MPADAEDKMLESPYDRGDSGGGNHGNTLPWEDVAITGISCRLPESDNMDEFCNNLMSGKDMITEDDRRWQPGLYGLPKRSGKLKDLTKCDASFFGVSPKQANTMDPQLRILLEVTYEAITDAGVNPQSIQGSSTGVFIGVSSSESCDVWSANPDTLQGYSMTGCQRAMMANRLSFVFDFKGPSYTIDTACSSSLLAMDQALAAIRSGSCQAAIVGGSNLCLKPQTALQFMKLGMLSPEGACKSFDESGNGYCRSEGIVAIYLQKESNAKRVYATILHSKNNADGNKEQGITFPSGETQKALIEQVYKEIGLSPSSVSYVEAHGTGTKVGDPQEVNAITDVFCQCRDSPLLIGSVKSNMGHSEPASGLASVAKVICAMEKRQLPGNLHFHKPNPDVPGLADGRLKVVKETQKWDSDIVGINSFGFGGANVHSVLKPHSKHCARSDVTADTQPRVFTFSSRTEEGLEHVLERIHDNAGNIELHSLMNANSFTPLNTHPFRGYTLLNTEGKVKEIKKCSAAERRPVWYVFAGMGTQWLGMGRDLMKIKAFHSSIMKSNAVLKPLGVDLYKMLMEGGEDVLSNSINAFVSIAAIQVALVDVLKMVGVQPDGMVGHSVGELGCGYADGTLTAEQTVLAAYWRGKCIVEADLEEGGMAAVGLTWNEAKHQCPPGVVPACHNSRDTVTISGPKDLVHQFVGELQERGVFAKEVQSAGVAFHSYYMHKIAPHLKAALDKVIVNPKPRSQRWISSSIPEGAWSSEVAQYSSAEYHVNNLVSPVLFQEALQHVPNNAITIEIAPHCLLQAILKRSLSSDCDFISLMKRNHPNNLDFFLANLGKLYATGLNIDVMKLYPAVCYPVSRGTPMISPLVQWDHSQTWDVPNSQDFLALAGNSESKNSYSFEIDTSPESENHYLLGHKIDGRALFPATGYVVLAWQAVAKSQGQLIDQLPITLEEIYIHRATILPASGKVNFEVNLMPSSEKFEISENGSLVASGQYKVEAVSITSDLDDKQTHNYSKSQENKMEVLEEKEVYRELRLRGYEYNGEFKGISSAHMSGYHGQIVWTGNWVTCLDTMLQMSVLSSGSRSLRLPTRIQSVHIDPTKMTKEPLEKQQLLDFIEDPDLNIRVAGGVEIVGLHTSVAPRRPNQQASPIFEDVNFVPYVQKSIQLGNNNLSLYIEHLKLFLLTKLNNVDEEVDEMQNAAKNLTLLNGTTISQDTIDMYIQHGNFEAFNILNAVFSKNRTASQTSNDLTKDPAFGHLLQGNALRACLDVALENCHEERLKMVELRANTGSMYSHILPHLVKEPLLNIRYIASDENEVHLKDDATSSIKATVWNTKQPAPSELKDANILVCNLNLSHTYDDLSQRVELLKDGGFFLLHLTTENLPLAKCLHLGIFGGQESNTASQIFDRAELIASVKEAGLNLVMEQSDGLFSTIFLFRKTTGNRNTSDVMELNVDSPTFEWVPTLQELLSSSESKPLWLVSSSPSSGIVGLVNCLRKETGGHRIRCYFDQEGTQDEDCLSKCLQTDLVMNIFKGGQWGSFRHQQSCIGVGRPKLETNEAYVNMLTRGDMSSLAWIDSPLKYQHKSPSQERCSVHYASLNFRDVMLATGKLSPDAIPGNFNRDCMLGMEFSGTDGSGRRIMGLVQASGLSTSIAVDPEFLWQVPESWSLEEAATVPVVYSTVYYSLLVRAQIRKGGSILIHSGSGGVGQAAISVALHRGCEVFTTVGTQEKRDYLLKTFPQLKAENICNSRDTSFEKHILKATKGKGVNVILNSLSEEKLQASIRLLAQHGHFLEIGKFDLSQNNPLGMSIFLKNVTFHGILLDSLFEGGNSDWRKVSDLVRQGIQSGAVQPLKTTVFDRDNVEAAFRFMAQGKHIGKVLIKVKEDTERDAGISAIARAYCDPIKSYIITGGLGGFGLELTNWLIERGARNIVLASRSGVRNAYQARRIQQWHRKGVNVIVSTKNISLYSETEELLQEAQSLGPVGGLFHLAMVLRDGLFENQTVETFQAVSSSKVTGTVHLDQATRALCKDTLHWFVVFSSISCGRGNAGQTNYGYANSVMERVCELRSQEKLPGLAIQWGAIGDVGVVLDTMGSNDTIIGGTLPQRMPSCLATLDMFLNQSHPVVSSFVLAEKQGAKSHDGSSDSVSLVDAVANILGVKDSSSLNCDSTLADLGLDSLMGAEVKQTIERYLDVVMSMPEIRLLTINKLKMLSTSENISNESNESMQKESDHLLLERASCKYNFQKLVPDHCIVRLPSKADETSRMKSIFLVHPIEGTTKPLEELSSHLKLPVYGIQCVKDIPRTSLHDLAAFYIKKMREVQSEGPYYLGGYSYGACVAFEMTLQLQKMNDDSSAVPYLTLLDGSTKFVTALIDKHRIAAATNESKAMCMFLQQFIIINQKEVLGELMEKSDLSLRAEHVSELLWPCSVFSDKEDIADAAKLYFHRLYMANEYSPDSKYNGNVTLIRTNSGQHLSLGNDYSLSEATSKDVKVEVVGGSHETFIQKEAAVVVAGIINKTLE